MGNAGKFKSFGDNVVRLTLSQKQLPPGAALVGIILSSDKTNISAMTGDRSAHPLLLSLANIKMDFRSKSSHHAYLLLALLPIPKFIHDKSKIRGVLESRLVHESLDIILEPLKEGARIGVMMSDPLGYLRYGFTPLAAYIVDTPESALLSGVAGKTSSVTMASHKQFGDPFRHEPRTASTTLAQLNAIEGVVDDVWDLENYIKEASKFRLNGVHRPFWRNWFMAEPSLFNTPEALHHWLKMFWDHDAKWCIRALGGNEIDFRFSVLHQHTGYRHFGEGVSKLKQVTGREHREMQRYIISVIAGAVPKDFLIAVRALMDFRYLAQATEADDNLCLKIDESLLEFHDHKDAILKAGARTGAGGQPIDNWYIPKLEFLQSVAPLIRSNGAAIQWSADVTEHAHITEIKVPASSTNNQDYESQICRNLDRRDKCRHFDLATSIRNAHTDFRGGTLANDLNAARGDNGVTPINNLTTTSSLLEHIDPITLLSGSKRLIPNYFKTNCGSDNVNLPRPLRTFSNSTTAFHLNYDPSYKRLTVDEVAEKYCLPDFRPALADYLRKGESFVRSIGGRRISPDGCQLPFDHLDVWVKVRLQSKPFFSNAKIAPPQTVNAAPRSEEWPLGKYDTALVNIDESLNWPHSGLQGAHACCNGPFIFLHVVRPPRHPTPSYFSYPASGQPTYTRDRPVFGICSTIRHHLSTSVWSDKRHSNSGSCIKTLSSKTRPTNQ